MKAIEDDIRASLAMLRRHINPLESPLYRLPSELFPEVASHFASEVDLINATHVSYRLRTALLFHPSLWSHLNFERETMARAFFERSGLQTPLHVDMARDTTRTVDSLAGLRQQSKRIATLKLRHWPIQKKFLSEPLPSLRRLDFFFHCQDEEWSEEWDTTWAPVWGSTERATSWTFPSLTTLIDYGLNPIPFYTPNLTCFKLWDAEGWAGIHDLICFLDSCPLLEHIDISYVEGHEGRHDLVVSLPNLRTYTQTTSGGEHVLGVLNMLSFPPFCSVKFRFPNHSSATADDILPHFKNPDYLAEIKRIKLRTTHSAGGNEVTGKLGLINAKGTEVCSERTASKEGRRYRTLPQGDGNDAHDVTHLDFLRNLNGISAETLCIDEYPSRDVGGATVEFLREVMGFGNVRTLILSRSAARMCLPALNEGPGASNHNPCFLSIHTLIIHTDSSISHLRLEVLHPLLGVAQKREVAGFPFKSVSLFHSEGSSRWLYGRDLDELRRCVGKLEVVIGEDALDWNLDKYFLDGLEHLQQNRDVQWD